MTDDPMKLIEWIKQRVEEIEAVLKQLDKAVEDYHQWMVENGYSEATCKAHGQSLKQFRAFISRSKYSFDHIFTKAAIGQFKKTYGLDQLNAVYGLARYLFDRKKISLPVSAPTTNR